jgi:hypothetical protein
VSYDPNKIKVKRSAFSQIPKTTTISVHYIDTMIGDERVGDVMLSCVNYYDRDSLKAALKTEPLGFVVMDVIDTSNLVTYIVQKP